VKVVILAGGLGTRISEESHLRPKPMIEIGEKPILWHIMKIYSHYGYNDFVVCLGYKGYVIKEYFSNYFLHESDVTFDFTSEKSMMVHHHKAEPWRVTLVETGLETQTGGRVKRVAPYIQDGPFLLTYGDGVGNVDIAELVRFHKSHGRLATVTATQPLGRYGALDFEGERVTGFREKPVGDGAWINAGFFVMEPAVLGYIENDATILERSPLEGLAQNQQLHAFKHRGFWQPMDTLRDKRQLEEMWASGKAPWKVWT
jgi:glucose-1-phosphate cytidylyltransferase